MSGLSLLSLSVRDSSREVEKVLHSRLEYGVGGSTQVFRKSRSHYLYHISVDREEITYTGKGMRDYASCLSVYRKRREPIATFHGGGGGKA